MDRNVPDDVTETTEKGIQGAEAFVKFVCQDLEDPLITPVVTPRFAPSCTPELMAGLGEISRKYHVPVQSHLSESIAEIDWVKELHPGWVRVVAVYSHEFHLYEYIPKLQC